MDAAVALTIEGFIDGDDDHPRRDGARLGQFDLHTDALADGGGAARAQTDAPLAEVHKRPIDFDRPGGRAIAIDDEAIARPPGLSKSMGRLWTSARGASV